MYIQIESTLYGDVLVFDYIDSYYTLSIKSWMISEYHLKRFGGELGSTSISRSRTLCFTACRQPVLVVWANVDAFIFPRNLLDYIDRTRMYERSYEIHGRQHVCAMLLKSGGNSAVMIGS